MRIVPIDIEIIASTRVRDDAVKRWLKKLGVSDNYLEELDDVQIPDPAFLVALAAKQCYRAFEPGLNPNVNRVRKDWTDYLTNILSQGHGSVLEHAVYSFALNGVSRVFTGEMNRHRAGVAISEASMRYIRFDDIPYWLPTSITLTEEEEQVFNDWDHLEGGGILHPATPEIYQVLKVARKKADSQKVFAQAFTQMEENYKKLSQIWADELKTDSPFKDKKHVTSMMRRIVGMGVATGGIWTLNLRSLRHIMALRASPAAEEEILHVWSRAGKMMVDEIPALFGDFTQTPEGYWVPKYAKV